MIVILFHILINDIVIIGVKMVIKPVKSTIEGII